MKSRCSECGGKFRVRFVEAVFIGGSVCQVWTGKCRSCDNKSVFVKGSDPEVWENNQKEIHAAMMRHAPKDL
jgi:hypothetical protein